MTTSRLANHFSQIFTTVIPAEQPEAEEDESREERRKLFRSIHKFVPGVKSAEELFDADLHIRAGPKFEENFGARQDEGITVKVADKALKIDYASSFAQCHLDAQILQNIDKKKYGRPTQIQKVMIPLIQTTKYDIIGRAQTGSGKTAAVMLPLIDEIQKDYASGKLQYHNDSPYVIVVAPTRELVQQLHEEARGFAMDTSVKLAVAYGDVPMQLSVNLLRKEGCDILITTMGRLCHYVRDDIISFRNLRYYIMDEADGLIKIQNRADEFEKNEYIRSQMGRHQHRTIMMSATFDEEDRELAKRFLRSPHCFVSVQERNTSCTHTILEVSHYEKRRKLVELLREKSEPGAMDERGYERLNTERTIVFKSGHRECDRLGIELACKGFRVVTIHSHRTQQQRSEAVEQFTRGVYHVIVASKLLARGMNLPNVAHVINFDLPGPEVLNEFIHRIGRVGRAGNLGRSTSFFDPMSADCVGAEFFVQALLEREQPVPDFLRAIVQTQQEIKQGGEQSQAMIAAARASARPTTSTTASASAWATPAAAVETKKKPAKSAVNKFDDTW